MLTLVVSEASDSEYCNVLAGSDVRGRRGLTAVDCDVFAVEASPWTPVVVEFIELDAIAEVCRTVFRRVEEP